jgi:thymidylate synthase
MKVADIRQIFRDKLAAGDFTEDGMLEIINASFIADEAAIFGTVNEDYVRRETDWYMSQSLNVNDIEEPIPAIWKNIATPDGRINSNYGWAIFSDANGNQMTNAIESLCKNKHSRQAAMIYNRPSMHTDACVDGMKDFMCTYSTQLLIRNDQLHYLVFMRSNDALLGYKNDRAWHDHVHDLSLEALQQQYPDLEKGTLTWNAGSLHVYPQHHKLVV